MINFKLGNFHIYIWSRWLNYNGSNADLIFIYQNDIGWPVGGVLNLAAFHFMVVQACQNHRQTVIYSEYVIILLSYKKKTESREKSA